MTSQAPGTHMRSIITAGIGTAIGALALLYIFIAAAILVTA